MTDHGDSGSVTPEGHSHGMSDRDILNSLRSGKLRPGMVGLSQIEVRFYGDRMPNRPTMPSDCDMVSQLWDDNRRVGNFMHCPDSVTDEPGDEIEGIGGEYSAPAACWYYPTFSYVSDDAELLWRTNRRPIRVRHLTATVGLVLMLAGIGRSFTETPYTLVPIEQWCANSLGIHGATERLTAYESCVKGGR